MSRQAELQDAVLEALQQALGGTRGVQPDLLQLAGSLGVCHQTLYRTLKILEAKGQLVRARVIELRVVELAG
jgi:DNA-binding MarR family transcriptional regulator